MTNEQRIWDGLKELIANPYGIAGLLGNLQAESGFIPDCLESTGRKALGMSGAEYTAAVDNGSYKEFVSDGYGYGLAQWTYMSHKQQMLQWAQLKKKSIGDLDFQIEFLRWDLQQFSSVLHVLRRATTVKEASDDVLLRYEKPADISDRAKARRAELGQGVFDRCFSKGNFKPGNVGFCALVQQALHERWGYIWGKYGQTWTQADQNKAEDEMSRKYGQQWVGRRVADCSGLGYWAFDYLGGHVFHGSNTMWNEYVKDKTKITNGKRADGKPMYPGDPVFIYKEAEGKRTHVGYYMGGGMVIEAAGTQVGVVTNIEGGKGKGVSKWSETAHWKDMQYTDTEDVITGGDVVGWPTLRKGATGEDVKRLQEKLNKLGASLTVDGVYGSGTVAAVKEFQAAHGLTADGICGPLTWTKIEEELAEDTPAPDIPEEPDEPVLNPDFVIIKRTELEAAINMLKGWLV